MVFKDRFAAASQLAERLQEYKDNPAVVIIAIPRGGLEVGSVLSRELHAPLDIMLTKKIGYPDNPEYAIGAVSLEDVLIDKKFLNVSPNLDAYIQEQVQQIRTTLRKRYTAYKGTTPPVNLKDKIVIVTDDGAATGNTLTITLELIKQSKPRKVIAALPVAPEDTVRFLRDYADEVICLLTPYPFYAVGQFYQNFEQVTDQEAIKLLQTSQGESS
jgi:putative phosphoribosyl transferase